MELANEKKPEETTELTDGELEAATGGALKYWGFVGAYSTTPERNHQFWFISKT